MKEAKKKKTPETSIGVSISALGAFSVYLITGLFLAVGFWVIHNIYFVDLISDPSLTLRLLWVLKLSFINLVVTCFSGYFSASLAFF